MSSCHQVWPDAKIIVLGNICGAQLLYDSDNGDLNPAKISWWRIFLFSNIQNLKLIFGSMLIMDVGDVTIFKSPTSPCHQFLFLAYMEILYYKKIHWNEFFKYYSKQKSRHSASFIGTSISEKPEDGMSLKFYTYTKHFNFWSNIF